MSRINRFEYVFDIESSAFATLNKRKTHQYGFTLAEVLITLMIIGVIAALTIPNLMQSWTRQALKSELKKAYSEINTVSQKFTSDNSLTIYDYMVEYGKDSHGYFGTEVLPAELSKYMKLLAYSPKDIATYTAVQMVRNKAKNFTNNEIEYILFDDGYFKDNRGREWFLERYTGPLISIDLNGLNKGPNRWGYDIFTFNIKRGNQQITPYQSKDYCDKGSSNLRNGMGCAYYALYDISPLDSKKSYWEDFLK